MTDIRGYPGYSVTSEGVVYSFKNKNGRGFCEHPRIMTQQESRNGYLTVTLSLGSRGIVSVRKVHRIVAETFIANPDNKKQVNHKDGNKHNNEVSNLEWVTHQENYEHALSCGLCPHKKKAVIQIYQDGRESYYESIHNASRETGVSAGNISRCCHEVVSQAGGYKWRFK